MRGTLKNIPTKNMNGKKKTKTLKIHNQAPDNQNTNN